MSFFTFLFSIHSLISHIILLIVINVLRRQQQMFSFINKVNTRDAYSFLDQCMHLHYNQSYWPQEPVK